MATQKLMLHEMKRDHRYRLSPIDDVLTPALLLYPEEIANNIDRTLALLSGDANRWRVHIKTAKLANTLRQLIDRGVQNFKCATTLELLTACRSGAADVLLAYPAMAANARRAQEIAQQFPGVRISVLAENEQQVRQWPAASVGIFLDINPGMNRTGIDQNDTQKIVALAQAVTAAGIEFRGLHYYDGQYGNLAEPERTQAAHRGYDHLLKLANELERSRIAVPEIITAGTPTFPCSLSYRPFRGANFLHRVSPGTVIYCDATSLAQLPAEYGYRPAALVLTRVVSHPHPGIITCDAGHKTVSADAGVPTCIVLGHPELIPLSPSEEHLPMSVNEGLMKEGLIEEGSPKERSPREGAMKERSRPPQIGEALFLLPRHICPTVNNFDEALLVRKGIIESTQEVTARGREAPLLHARDEATSVPGR
jgi:D-serine deaminase-like pyridoxal phosphate-dependent protein